MSNPRAGVRIFCIALIMAACLARADTHPGTDPRDTALLVRMTLREKINQLMLLSKGTMTGPDSAGRPNISAEELARSGIGFQMSPFEFSAKDINRIQRIAVSESRLGIPVVFSTDIIHGYWTVFPVPLGMAATFDANDARIAAGVAGREGYSHGQRWTFAPMVDHPVDPRWGRVVETFGESPLVASDYAVATIDGFHRSLADLPGTPAPRDFGVATCLKHYLGYGASQAGKDYAYVDLSERSLRELHLPPYIAGLKAGAPAVMPAFTTINGVPMSANRHWLQDVLRGELGFDGVLVSDYAAITEMRNHGTAADDLDAAVKALRDGSMTLDMEDGVYYAQLEKAVNAGRVRVADIDREVLRALAFKRKLGLFEKPYVPEDLEQRVRLSHENREATREVARKSIVLLKNDSKLLPLAGQGRILVTGPLADAPGDLLGPWHARGEAKDTPSVLAAFRDYAARMSDRLRQVDYSEGVQLDARGNAVAGDEPRIAAAVDAARNADVIVAVIGERERQSGEANNRAHLDLPGNQQKLIDALADTHKPLVVVLLTGRALAVPRLVEKSNALLHAFYPGTEGGFVIAHTLFGGYNPGGKEPVTWPRDVGQIPIHHYDPPNGRPNIPERGDYKAHWLDEPDEPLFDFGFGLSYSTFRLEGLALPARVSPRDMLTVRARLTNTSDRYGDEVPQLYVRPRVAGTVAGKRLVAYRRVRLEAHESRDIELSVPARALATLDAQNRWTLAPGIYEVTLGTSSRGGLAGTFELVAPARAAARHERTPSPNP